MSKYKFIALTVVLDFIYSAVGFTLLGFLFGILGLKELLINPVFTMVVVTLIGIAVVWPAIVTASHIVYKNKTIDMKQVMDNVVSLTIGYALIDVILTVALPDLMILNIVGFLNVPIAYFVSKYYLKKRI